MHRGYRTEVAEAILALGESETPTVDAMREAKANGWTIFGLEEAAQLAKGRAERALDNKNSTTDSDDDLRPDGGISYQE